VIELAMLTPIKNAWRKNSAELMGLMNGAIPEFVMASRPPDRLAGVPVFCYHLVESEWFEEDLEFLKRNGYHTLTSSQLTDSLTGVRDVPERSVLLTFDDGPGNFNSVAFPLLQKYRSRAVAFIAPGLHGNASADSDFSERPMTWEEMAVIHASGLVEFQSHTLESRFVPKWPQPAALSGCDPLLESRRRRAPLGFTEDLSASKRMIESRLPGAKVDQLCFPQYLGTAEAIDAAKSLGFRGCHWGLTAGRPLNTRGDSPFHVSRVTDEYLRRLPGSGRISLRELMHQRIHRIQTARAWRQRVEQHRG
jgi:peptidoglycan/xylan/chitin deacetylase (PgdA/CDA1 family)